MAERIDADPAQGRSQILLPIDIQTCEGSANVTARAGLVVFVETLRALQLPELVNREVCVQQRRSGSSDWDRVQWLLTLLMAGGECIDDIQILAADQGLVRLLGQEPPSASVLRRFLYAFDDPALIARAKAALGPDHSAYRVPENDALQGLASVQSALVQRGVVGQELDSATLDHDATIIESHQQEARAHYKGGRGYQPSLICWSEADLVLADEFRDGNVPAGMANLDLIQRGFATLPDSGKSYFFRADSACYEESVLKWLANPDRKEGPKGQIGFSISADMSKQLRKICVAVPADEWTLVEERVDETVECAEVVFVPGDWPKNAQPLRDVAMRIQRPQQTLLQDGCDTKYLAVVSNRSEEEISGPELLRWHWGKAGTIERIHDVMKNELGAGVLPCGRFGANAAWYRLSAITYNVQSILKRNALPPALHKARPKRLRFTLFTMPGRVASHARRLVLRVAKAAADAAGLVRARANIARLAELVEDSS